MLGALAGGGKTSSWVRAVELKGRLQEIALCCKAAVLGLTTKDRGFVP